MYIRIYVYMYTCICTCTYIYIYIHRHLHVHLYGGFKILFSQLTFAQTRIRFLYTLFPKFLDAKTAHACYLCWTKIPVTQLIFTNIKISFTCRLFLQICNATRSPSKSIWRVLFCWEPHKHDQIGRGGSSKTVPSHGAGDDVPSSYVVVRRSASQYIVVCLNSSQYVVVRSNTS